MIIDIKKQRSLLKESNLNEGQKELFETLQDTIAKGEATPQTYDKLNELLDSADSQSLRFFHNEILVQIQPSEHDAENFSFGEAYPDSSDEEFSHVNPAETAAVTGSQPAAGGGNVTSSTEQITTGAPSNVDGSDDGNSVDSNDGKKEGTSILSRLSSMIPSFTISKNKVVDPAANAENATESEEQLLARQFAAEAIGSAMDTIENNAKRENAATTIQKVYRGGTGRKQVKSMADVVNTVMNLGEHNKAVKKAKAEMTPEQLYYQETHVEKKVSKTDLMKSSRAVRYAKLTKRNELLNALYGRDRTTLFSETVKPYDNSVNSASNIRKDVYHYVQNNIESAIIAGNENVEISLAKLEGMGLKIDEKHLVHIKEVEGGQTNIVRGIKIPVMYMDKAHKQLKPLDIDVDVKIDPTTKERIGYERGNNITVDGNTVPGDIKLYGVIPLTQGMAGSIGYTPFNWLGHKMTPGVSSRSLDSMYNPNNDQKKANRQNYAAGVIGMVAAFWLILSANQVATGAALIGTLAIPGGPAIVLGFAAAIIAVTVGIYVFNHWDSVKQGLLFTGAVFIWFAMRAFELVIAKPFLAIGLIAVSALRFALNLLGNALKVAGIVIATVGSIIGYVVGKAIGSWKNNSEMIELLIKEVRTLRNEVRNGNQEISNDDADIKEELGAQTTSAWVDVKMGQFYSHLSFQAGLIGESCKSFGNSLSDVWARLSDVVNRLLDYIKPMLGLKLKTSDVIRAEQVTTAATASGQGGDMVATTSTESVNGGAFDLFEKDTSSQKQDKYDIQKKADQKNESCKDFISKGQDVLFHGNVSSSILSLFPKAVSKDSSELEPLLGNGHKHSNDGV
ncbi:MAG: hypothetical protein P8L77_00605 [Gammaproteobacteria bacterium]|nr:hypothetical protein [Gammaproteobacteria bacterium]